LAHAAGRIDARHGRLGALLVLTVSQASSPAVGLAYVALFGIGSMIGMGALSTVIAVPLAVSARWLTWANSGLQSAVGCHHHRDRCHDDCRNHAGVTTRVFFDVNISISRLLGN